MAEKRDHGRRSLCARIDRTELGADVGLVNLGGSFTASQGDQAGITVDNHGRTLPSPTFGFILRVSDMLSLGVAHCPEGRRVSVRVIK